MNYAKQTYYQGNLIPTTEEFATQRTIVPTAGGVFGMGTPNQRPQRNPKRPSEKRPQKPSTNDILRNVFMPKMVEIREVNINERDFLKSLSKLAKHYGFEPTNVQNEPYPYNVHLAYHYTKKQLENNELYTINLKLLKTKTDTYLSVEEIFNTRNSLFHIPIKPLYLMLKSQKTKPLAKLLLSVYSYFYSIGIPYYCDDDFLFYHYEMLIEWIMYDKTEDEEEQQEQQRNLQALKECNIIGNLMYKKIKNHKNLTFFEKRLKTFSPKNNFEYECKELAGKVYQLYTQYPNENIYRYSTYEPQEYEEYETITMDKYIGFVATANDWISNQIIEMLNSEFNECSEIEEPTIRRDFTKNSKKDKRNFDFENSLFESISDIYYLLTKI